MLPIARLPTLAEWSRSYFPTVERKRLYILLCRLLLDESMKRLESRADEILGNLGRMDRMLDSLIAGDEDCPRLFILTPAAGTPTVWKPLRVKCCTVHAFREKIEGYEPKKISLRNLYEYHGVGFRVASGE